MRMGLSKIAKSLALAIAAFLLFIGAGIPLLYLCAKAGPKAYEGSLFFGIVLLFGQIACLFLLAWFFKLFQMSVGVWDSKAQDDKQLSTDPHVHASK